MWIKTFISFFLFLLMISPSLGEIKTLKISSDSRPLILLGKFGFTARGRGQISIAVSGVSFTVSDPSLLGFFLFSIGQAIPNPNPTGCLLSSPYVRPLFTFGDPFNSSFTISHPDDYILFFANCAPETRVSFAIRTEMFNTLPDGSHDYLPVGLAPVLALYCVFAIAYAAILAAWAFLCLQNWFSTHRIHILMGGLLLVKALNLAFAARDYVRLTGSGSPLHGFSVLIYILRSWNGILFFSVLTLICAGWPFLKPILEDREKMLLKLVIPLQLLAHLASVALLIELANIVCSVAAYAPIYWTTKSLKEASKADGKAATRNRAKLNLMEKLRDVFAFYLQFSMLFIFVLKVKYAYLYSLFVDEAATLAFYIFMFYTLRPKERAEYFVVDDNKEEEEAALD